MYVCVHAYIYVYVHKKNRNCIYRIVNVKSKFFEIYIDLDLLGERKLARLIIE